MLPLHADALDVGATLIAQALRAGAGVRDTVVTIVAPTDPGWFARLTSALGALVTIAFLVLTVAVTPAAWKFRKSYDQISALLDKVYADINPITHHASRITENVDYISTAIRADVQQASALLTRAERTLEQTLARAEARARDLEALIDVAQREAEHSLIAAASTVAGVREGVQSLRDDLAAGWSGDAVSGTAGAARTSQTERWDDVLEDEAALGDADDPVVDDLSLVDARPMRTPLTSSHAVVREDVLESRPRVRSRRPG